MIDGRHCNEDDLTLLVKSTKEVMKSLSNEAIKEYLKLVSRFDDEIAMNMQNQIDHVSNDIDKIKKIIETNFEILKQNVIVDIYEHR